MEAGRITAGSSRALRLDPFSLPVRFEAADDAADERLRVVDLHRERVVVRRSVRGMRMALNMPVAAFRGIAIRLHGETGHCRPRSPSCSNTAIPLYRCRCLLGRKRRHRRRMADLGPRARPAAAGRRE